MDPRLIILGLMKKGPMHGYELQRVMKLTRADQWAGLLKGSIYHALKTMAAEGLLKVRATDAARGRVKAVYEITARGRSELKQLLRTSWLDRDRGFPASLFGAVAFLDELAPEEVLTLIERHRAWLSDELKAWRDDERKGHPPQVRLILEAASQHLETDLRLIQSLELLLDGWGARR